MNTQQYIEQAASCLLIAQRRDYWLPVYDQNSVMDRKLEKILLEGKKHCINERERNVFRPRNKKKGEQF